MAFRDPDSPGTRAYRSTTRPYALMSSVVTVYGAFGSFTGGSCTGTGRGSSVGVSGASSAGSRSRGSEFGLSGVFLNSVMHKTVHDRYRPHRRRFFLARAGAGRTGLCLVALSNAASSTDRFT